MSQNTHSHNSPPPTNKNCCSTVSAQLKLYQAFIFSVPIFFTLTLLFLFYLFYLRRPRADWSSLRMRTTRLTNNDQNASRCDLGLKKELREMLPIIVFNESFYVKDTQCSVCLADYKADDKLQQIPICGHTFHMECIDLWLATHTTCPLCRLSLLASPKTSTEPPDNSQAETTHSPDDGETHNEGSPHYCSWSCQDPPQLGRQTSNLANNIGERNSETSSSTQVRA